LARTSFPGVLRNATLLTVFTLASLSAARGQYRELYDFPNSNIDGGVILDSAGNIYGATDEGGGASGGVVFELVMPGDSLNILHTFNGSPDGAGPNAPLVFDRAGNLYGTTYIGGAYNAGTVFMMSPALGGQWLERVLYSFTGGPDGGYPQAAVLLDNSGHLYGTTTAGGTYGQGVVYRLNISAVPLATTLHSFGAPGDGIGQTGSLVADAAGNLYGTTYSGGASQLGTAYELSPTNIGSGWAETVLWSFPGTEYDGENPVGGLVFNAYGYLVGAAEHGGTYGLLCQSGNCGALFALVPLRGGWSEYVLYAYEMNPCDHPVGPLAIESSLESSKAYYPDLSGGNGGGCLDEAVPREYGEWLPEDLDYFPNEPGLQPNGGVVVDRQGNIYGTYSSQNYAAVYEFTPLD